MTNRVFGTLSPVLKRHFGIFRNSIRYRFDMHHPLHGKALKHEIKFGYMIYQQRRLIYTFVIININEVSLKLLT